MPLRLYGTLAWAPYRHKGIFRDQNFQIYRNDDSYILSLMCPHASLSLGFQILCVLDLKEWQRRQNICVEERNAAGWAARRQVQLSSSPAWQASNLTSLSRYPGIEAYTLLTIIWQLSQFSVRGAQCAWLFFPTLAVWGSGPIHVNGPGIEHGVRARYTFTCLSVTVTTFSFPRYQSRFIRLEARNGQTNLVSCIKRMISSIIIIMVLSIYFACS